jgi:hypothetical protein
MFDDQTGYLTRYVPNSKNVEMRRKMSADMAAVNRTCEQEHCNDYAYAFQITLMTAQTRITTAAQTLGDAGQRYQKRELARKGANQALRTASANLHPRLKEIFRAATSRGYVQSEFTKALEDVYKNAIDCTAARDFKSWHTFDVDRSTPSLLSVKGIGLAIGL